MLNTNKYTRGLHRREIFALSILLWLMAISIPITLGEIGMGWDTLNHHIYLGWTAEKPRFDRDVLAASYQTYQFPYLYWPVYYLASNGYSGVVAGVVLNTMYVSLVPAMWLVAYACIPGNQTLEIIMRAVAVVLGFVSSVVLQMLDTTANDLLASIPMFWAIALALRYSTNEDAKARVKRVTYSGLLGGVAVAVKFSNGPFAIMLPILWLSLGYTWTERFRLIVTGSVVTIVAFILAYGYWGWQLWVYYKNPIFPFARDLFMNLNN